MAFCTGNPDTGDHCCWLPNRVVCPHLLSGEAALTAKAAEVIDRLNVRGNRRGQVRNLTAGVNYACGLAVDALADWWDANGRSLPDRAAFEAAWAAAFTPGQPGAAVGDAWESRNRPRTWCVSYGPTEGKCCFRPGDSQAGDAIPVEVRGIRQGIGGVS